MKFLRFLLTYALLVSLTVAGVFLYEENSFFKDQGHFRPPFVRTTGLRIRNDRLGKGYFGAPRNGRRRHLGIDLLAPEGELVIAVRSGYAEVIHQEKGMGTFVKMMHPDGLQTIYGHLSETYLPGPTRVRQGQVIGAVGKSGNASSPEMQPHLHFEIRNGKKALNPTPLFREALVGRPGKS